MSEIQGISEHAQEPPEVANDSNIPPFFEWWFLTNQSSSYKF